MPRIILSFPGEEGRRGAGVCAPGSTWSCFHVDARGLIGGGADRPLGRPLGRRNQAA